jgi:hypothetical protein
MSEEWLIVLAENKKLAVRVTCLGNDKLEAV